MKVVELKSTERFSNRVDYYVKYRPHYPVEILSFLEKEIFFNKKDVVADVGSGTGILSELFLKNGNTVFGVEPNKEMREAGEEYLKNYNNFKSINGTAENTGLEDKSIDVVAVGQAFHWFDEVKCQYEFRRILRNKKHVLLIWNERILEDFGFMSGYEEILQQFSTDYGGVTNRNFDENKIKSFYEKEALDLKYFNNNQILDVEGLLGRSFSASYTPTEDNPNYMIFINELKELFGKFQKEGFIEMRYKTKIYWGNL